MTSKLPKIGTFDRGTVRRALLLVALVSLVATAGCLDSLSDDDGASGDPVESVPENQDMLLHADMAVLQDEAVMNASNALMGSSTNQEDVEEGLDEIENEIGLDVRSVDELLLFGTSEDFSTDVSDVQDEQFGVVLHTDWSEDEFVSAINEDSEDGELVATSYEGQEVLYEPSGSYAQEDQPAYLGVLGDGAFVFGTEQSVKGSLDVEYAGASSISGSVRDAYDDTRDGYVTVATRIPEEETDQVDSEEWAQDLSAMSGVLYTNEDDNEIGVEGTLAFTSSDSASQVHDELQAGIDEFQNQDPIASTFLQGLSIDREGSSLVVSFEDDARAIAGYIQAIAGTQGATQF